ncbi:MAG TPA: HTTM domain-containing protein [Flavobacterium sp.]|nr:HTTM domain-containing protein [Flavobacterium sp.]
MWKKVFEKRDNAPLIVFRIFLGLVFLAESVGSFFTGWINFNFINTNTNFTFIGFEWLLNIQNETMYVVFGLMALVSLGIIFGFKYRFSIIALTVLWGLVYFGQKTSYNNHYYLMWLIALIMCFLPANAYASYDVKKNPGIKKLYMPRWISWVFILQISCVYFYATIAKFYPDWLDGTVTSGMFMSMKNMPQVVLDVFHKKDFQLFIAYMGIAFDGLIIPALLWKRTRWLAIIGSLIFHVFNSITLQIGVFPYFALSFSIFFFPAEQVRKFFLRKKQAVSFKGEYTYDGLIMFRYFFIPYLILQIVLPLRHWAIKDDVLWTEEGHRLSWRMMLRARSGEARFKVVNKNSGEILKFSNEELLTDKQRRRLNAPDVIWQMTQKIQQHFKEQGKEVEVYVINSNVRINSHPSKRLIDPTVDLAAEKWSHFKHHDWILDRNAPQDAYSKRNVIQNLKVSESQK